MRAPFLSLGIFILYSLKNETQEQSGVNQQASDV